MMIRVRVYVYVYIHMYVSTHMLESKKNASTFSIVVECNEYKPV